MRIILEWNVPTIVHLLRNHVEVNAFPKYDSIRIADVLDRKLVL